jgi:hypothetical protein
MQSAQSLVLKHSSSMSETFSPELEALVALLESPAALEILLLVRASPGKSFTARGIGKELQITAASAERELALLCGRGFLAVSLGNDLNYAYRPMSPEVDGTIGKLAALWTTDRDAIMRALMRKKADPIRAFAAAFRFRDGDDDG